VSILIEKEDGTIVDDTYVTSIDSIMILKELMGDDKIFDKDGEWTEYGRNKLKELRKKWCLENQKYNYNN
jgi:16S rRNA C1402 N4-methylase RsmH